MLYKYMHTKNALMKRGSNLNIYLSFFSGCRAEDNVAQPTEDVMVVEGQQTTLTCLYDTTDRLPYLFWYKQQANGKPMFMLRKDTVGVGETAAEFKERFHARDTLEDDITPTSPEGYYLEGSRVKLSCNYTVKAGSLLWYRQYSGSGLQFLYLITTTNNPYEVRGGSYEQTIEPNQHEVYAEVGSNVQLSCNYSSAYSLLWYKQPPGSAPQYLLLILHSTVTGYRAESLDSHFSVNANNLQGYRQYPGSAPQFLLLLTDTATPLVVEATPPYPRMTAKLNDERTPLDLENYSAEVTDSALYYCGSYQDEVQPTTKIMHGDEGGFVTLSCNYSGSPYNLQWYRQYPRSAPKFLLLTTVSSSPSVQTIQPNQHEVYGEEGSNVQLSCNYSSAYSVLWYKQYPGSAPQLLLFIHNASRTVVRAKPPYSHLTVKLNKEKTCVDLEISSAEVRDSALYYCNV
ncbi:unnamed protein product [Coregonus sp. 'balchen']|nr:unnamed protein product [Coregonus sp. 'balchen']